MSAELAAPFGAQLAALAPLAGFMAVGAYGYAMSSNYNARCRAAEVLVTGGTHRLIRRRETFADLVRAETAERDHLGRDRGAGIVPERAVRGFEDGVREPTGNPFDMAISGKGFLLVEADDGRRFLTRAGHFTPDAQGRLRDGEGFALLGQGGPLVVPATGRVAIGRDGTLSVETPGQPAAVLDRVRVVEVADPRRLDDVNGQYFQAGETPLADAVSSHLHQGFLERSNVDGVAALVEMIALQRRHDAAQKALTEQSNLGGQLGEIMRS